MATYKKRTSLNNLKASINLNYGAKGLVKSLSREYNEVYEVKKTVKDSMIQILAFNTDAAFLAGTLKDCKYLLPDIVVTSTTFILIGAFLDSSGLAP